MYVTLCVVNGNVDCGGEGGGHIQNVGMGVLKLARIFLRKRDLARKHILEYPMHVTWYYIGVPYRTYEVLQLCSLRSGHIQGYITCTYMYHTHHTSYRSVESRESITNHGVRMDEIELENKKKREMTRVKDWCMQNQHPFL